jgi:hypothetical protein
MTLLSIVKFEAIGNAPPSPILELIKISSENSLLGKIELCEDCAEKGQEINAACSFCLKLYLRSLHEWMLDCSIINGAAILGSTRRPQSCSTCAITNGS